jgi:hypothetical protein
MYLRKETHFSNNYYHTSHQGLKVNDSAVAPFQQLRASSMLSLLAVENYKNWIGKLPIQNSVKIEWNIHAVYGNLKSLLSKGNLARK